MDFDLPFMHLESAAAVVDATKKSPGEAPTLAEERWGSVSIVEGVVERLRGDILVVVVVRDERQAAALEVHPSVVVIVDYEWAEGAAAPLRAALDWISQQTDAAVSVVAELETPDVSAQVVKTLREVQARSEAEVVVPKYRYRRGAPVLLHESIWPRFLGAEGDLDLVAFLSAHPDWVEEIRIDTVPPRRITDTDDLADLHS